MMKFILRKLVQLPLVFALLGFGIDSSSAQETVTKTATVEQVRNDLARINKGIDDGVRLGQNLMAIRRGRDGTLVLGNAVVRAVRDRIAAIRLTDSDGDYRLRPGDEVILEPNADQEEHPVANAEDWQYLNNGSNSSNGSNGRGIYYPNVLARKGLGIKGGLTFANLNGDVAFSGASMRPSAIWSHSFGAFFVYRFSNNFALQPEVLYTAKGAKLRNGPVDVELRYLEMPLLLKISLPLRPDASIIPSLLVGPEFALNIESRIISKTLQIDETSTESHDYGMVFGVGVDFPLIYGTLTFDVRYTLGLTRLDDLDAQNSVVSLMAGFSF